MMRRWALLGIVLGAAAGLVLHAPAAWLADGLARATDGRVLLLEPRGTVWQGGARLQLAPGRADPAARVLPGRLTWSWGWDGGAPVLAVQADCCTTAPQRVRVEPGWSRWTFGFSDSLSQWPADLLSAAGAPWNSLQPEGQLRLQLQGLSLEWSGDAVRPGGALQVDALGVASRLSTLRPVGSYRLSLQAPAADAAPTLRLQTLEGPLRLDGSGEWVRGAWRFRGEAGTDARSEAALENLLNVIGRRDGSKSVLSWG